uniref:Phosphatidylinositol transfer protein membrane associated 2 n=1 Tax=Cyprinus carpio TaxID=7962 RepID=A0A8C2AU88_CYPCA
MVYHIGQHIPSWFRSILPKAALRVEEESWNAYPYTRTRYTCPFVEKFSIDIETYYKPDTGCQNEVFNMSSAERRQRDIDPIDIVNEFIAPHEYLVEEDPKLYKSYKTQRGPLSDDWITEINNNPGKMPVMCAYKLCKVEFRYWGMQSKIERFIHDVGLRKVMVRAHRQAWCWQDEWYGLTMEDIRQLELETQLALAQKMAQYSCNEEGGENNAEGTTRTMGDTLQARGELTKQWSTSSRSSRSSKRGGMYTPPYFKNLQKQLSKCVPQDGSSQQCLQPSKIHVLILVLHGGNILDTGSGDQNSKQGDVNTISSAFDAVMRVHYPTALGRIAIRLVPCPAVCVEAFSLVSNLSPYSYDEGCLSNSQDHIPLAALPLLATSAPQYQDAVATVIVRANQVYGDFIKSLEGATFTGQVCLMGDCVGGILGFDALCSSNVTVSESQNSSRRGSIVSVQDNDLLSPGIIINSSHCSGSGSGSGLTLEGSRHLSRSNIDIPRSSGPDDPKKQLPRKRSDSSTYELDTIKQHQAFLTSLHSSVLRTDPGSRRSSSSTMLEGGGALGKFDFEVSDFFLFGSPLGLVLALRKTVVPALDVAHLRPACQQVYNLFHPADPSASRLEPLLEKRFHLMPPFSVPRYQRFPLGDGQSALLADAMQSHSIMFADHSNPSSPASVPAFRGARRASETSIASQVSGLVDSYTASNIANSNLSKKLSLLSQLALPYNKSGSRSSSPKSSKAQNKQQVERQDSSCLDDSEQIAARWWGTKRIDFALYCPDALTAFPTVALPHLFHASYWESTDVVSFLLRQVMRHENSSILELDGKEVSEFTPSKPREKWIRKRTHVKIRNVTANHRVNDAVFTEDGNQVVTGRFMYGPLDMVTLTGEKVDIHIMTQPPSGEWVYFSTELTNSSGRVSYTIPESKRLSIGVYPVKMVVRGDHTSADSYLTVLPRGTEFVVFSIDGSFAASVSIMGSDPKVRAGAVDVVRHWQDLGYLIVYVTGRPDMQKQRVVAWLSQHNFPHGIVSFCDGLVHDPLRHKANFLKSLITEAHMKIFAAYGSTKDISVYTSLGLPPAQIYIVGRPTKKMQHQCQFIADGYASHLSQLEYNQRSRPAKTGSTRMVLRKGSFGLGGSGDFLRKRNHLLRTISSQPTSSTPPVHIGRPERAQSQSECDRERAERAQRSMSIAAGCWGRTSRLEGGALSPK